MPSKLFSSIRGFTLVEVIITISIFSLVMVTVLSFTVRGYQSFFRLNDSSSQIAQGRSVIDRLVKEVRAAAPSDNGAYAIASASDEEIIFYANVDSDDDNERLRYFLIGSSLNRGVINPTGIPAVYDTNDEIINTLSTIVSNGATTPFQYFSSTYSGSQAPLSEPINVNDVRNIKLTFLFDENPNKQPLPVTVITSVTLRNLKDNL